MLSVGMREYTRVTAPVPHQTFMVYLGIERPDNRPPEVKAAADKIQIGYLAFSDHAVFRCSECGETDWMPHDIKHKPECEVGRVLNEWQKSFPWYMRLRS